MEVIHSDTYHPQEEKGDDVEEGDSGSDNGSQFEWSASE
jgi:hypothetical protein